MAEAASWMTSSGLHAMFVLLLIHSPPANPGRLLDRFIDELSDDCKYLLRRWFPEVLANSAQVHDLGRYLFSTIIDRESKTWADLGLPQMEHLTWDLF
jgi:hypothetical protein